MLAEQDASSAVARAETPAELRAANMPMPPGSLPERAPQRWRRASAIEQIPQGRGLLGLDVEPHEADALATFGGVLGFGAGIFASGSSSLWAGACPTICQSFSRAGRWGARIRGSCAIPAVHGEKARLRSLGKSPETVRLHGDVAQFVPSLERAVLFAAENGEEPLSSALRKVIWSVETRQSLSIDDSFMDFAAEWSGDGEELKMALYSIRGAVSEKTKEGRERVLEKATESALAGTRRRIEDFASGLSGPSTILFALGILLPLVVGSMLPMMAIGTLDVSNLESGLSTGGDPRATAVITVLLMDVAFPGIAFAYAYSVIGRRPGTSSPPQVAPVKASILAPVAVAALFAILAVFVALGGSEGELPAAALLALGAISVPAGYHLASVAAHSRIERKRIMDMEAEFPDALFQLGRRVAEGVPLEAAFPFVGGMRLGIGRLFISIGGAMASSGLSPKGVSMRAEQRHRLENHKGVALVVASAEMDGLRAR